MLKVIRTIISKTEGFSSADVFEGLQQLTQLRGKVRGTCKQLLFAGLGCVRGLLQCVLLPACVPVTSLHASSSGVFYSHSGRLFWPPFSAQVQCRAELTKIDLLVVPTSAYNYTVQEIQVGGGCTLLGICMPACLHAL
jgi:hypothetical protein